MALHLIDSAMVGAISYKHLAAAALVINAMNIPFVIGIGMTISVSQMVSLANGKPRCPAGIALPVSTDFAYCARSQRYSISF
jgi:hypothetical protein